MSVTPTFGKRGEEAVVKFSGGSRTGFFSIDDGETAFVRFLTDFKSVPSKRDSGLLVGGWPAFVQHQNIPTKGQPESFTGNWPKAMAAPCRHDDQFGGGYPDCYICDVWTPQQNKPKKPGKRWWALGALRERVEENGQLKGYRDVTRTYTKTVDGKEEEVTERVILVFNMGWKNFFSTLQGFGTTYGTLLDRDYQITRKGDGTDTDYWIIPLDPIQKEGRVFDLRDPEFMSRYLPEAPEVGVSEASDARLIDLIAERASDDFYNLFFDTRNSAPVREGQKSDGQTPVQPPAPQTDAPSADVQSLIDRVKGYSPAQAGEAPAAPVPAGVGAGPVDLD